jgi:endonuclease/exonuclease/phosphatase family metal-dependent hydrolase
MILKIVTLNTWKCDGHYQARLDWMGDALAALRPDFILLQEVFRSVDGALATDVFLKERLGLQAYWTPARRKIRQLAGQMYDSHSGLAILSRYNCQFIETLVLPSNKTDGGRAAQLAVFEIAGQQLLFANLHLSYLPKSDALKIQQVQAVLNRLPDIPFEIGFLAGDLNSTPNSSTVKYLLTHTKWLFQDAYVATQTADKFATGDTHYHHSIGKRIDYIFTINPKLKSVKWEITRSEVVMNVRNPDGLLPSDHFGVMATLQIV